MRPTSSPSKAASRVRAGPIDGHRELGLRALVVDAHVASTFEGTQAPLEGACQASQRLEIVALQGHCNGRTRRGAFLELLYHDLYARVPCEALAKRLDDRSLAARPVPRRHQLDREPPVLRAEAAPLAGVGREGAGVASGEHDPLHLGKPADLCRQQGTDAPGLLQGRTEGKREVDRDLRAIGSRQEDRCARTDAPA